MKKINKDAYREARYGKKTLMIISIVIFALCLGALAGGISMFVIGLMSGILSKMIWMPIVGGLLAILAIVFGIFSIIMFFTSVSMINVEQGSVKDGNRAIGTVNVVKCDKCGEELPDNAAFCSKCGTAVEGVKTCECGAANEMDAEYCVSCGKKLK